MDLESVVMEIIVNSGQARSYAYEALTKAKEGDFDGAEILMSESAESANAAHTVQTQLIEQDQGTGKTPMTLVLVHAQDHLMTSMLAREMVTELITLHRRLAQQG